MRARIASLLLGLALAAVPMSSVLADTGGGGGGTDLGLEAITINGGSVAAKTGFVTLDGAISCSQDLTAFVGVEATQVVGRFNTIRGWGGQEVSCSAGDTAAFSLSFFADQGKFAPGNVRISAYAETYVCVEVGEDYECSYDVANFGPASLRLSGR